MAFLIDFEDNVDEIEKYFEFLILIDNITKIENIKPLRNTKVAIDGKNKLLLRNAIDDTGNYNVNQELRKILKATCYLLLYNLVEGAMNSALNEYFNSFSTKKKQYRSVRPPIQSLWLKYKHKLFKDSKPNDIVTALSGLFDEIVEIAPKTIDQTNVISDYNAYTAHIGKADFSGNIDALKIRELAALYGFRLPKNSTCASLLTVKNRRNILAHGNSTFMEVGKESTETLVKIKDETIKFMRSVLKQIDNSIKKEVFLT